MTYFMSPDSNHRRRRPRGPAQNAPRGPKLKPNAFHPKCRAMSSSLVAMLRQDILTRYIVSSGHGGGGNNLTALLAPRRPGVRPRKKVVRGGRGASFWGRARPLFLR